MRGSEAQKDRVRVPSTPPAVDEAAQLGEDLWHALHFINHHQLAELAVD
jgi:hypothetical protein